MTMSVIHVYCIIITGSESADMDPRKSDRAREYELEYPRREYSSRRAWIGFMTGLLGSAFLVLIPVVIVWGAAYGAFSDAGIEVVIVMIVALVVAAVLPFALAYKRGMAESPAAFNKRRDHALGIGPPLNFWYGMTGRVNRGASIAGTLIAIGLGIIAVVGVDLIGSATNSVMLSIAFVVPFYVVQFGIMASIAPRRLHDLGYSGWYAVPVVMISPMALLLLCLIPGNEYPNKYGPQPPKFEIGQMALRRSQVASSERDGQ